MCIDIQVPHPTLPVDFLLDLRDSGRLSPDAFARIARENAIRVLGLS